MRRLVMVLGIASCLVLLDAADALSRGRGGGGGGRGGGVGRGSNPGGNRSGRNIGRRNTGRNTGRDAKELEELQKAEERLAEIQERRDALNEESRKAVQEAYALKLRLESIDALGGGS